MGGIMIKQLLLSFFVIVALSGCANHMWWPELDSEQLCLNGRHHKAYEKEKKLIPSCPAKDKFKAEGHISTTHIVAIIAGQHNYAEKYALYSQVPDAQALRFSAPAVSVWGTVTFWEWFDYRHNINAILHSLHGGNEIQVNVRREKLANLINDLVKDDPENNAWKIGFLIHALGDSYAHVYDDGNGNNTRAYGELIGHLFEKGSFRPDSIPSNLENYLAFVKALYTALNTGNGNSQNLDKYIVHVRKVVDDAKDMPPSQGEEYVERKIRYYNSNLVDCLHYCSHKQWTDVVTMPGVNKYLNQIQEYLE